LEQYGGSPMDTFKSSLDSSRWSTRSRRTEEEIDEAKSTHRFWWTLGFVSCLLRFTGGLWPSKK
ncbi:MAG: hypothetical protein ACREUU_18445, partial [Gammaproteobacteria bacterium]